MKTPYLVMYTVVYDRLQKLKQRVAGRSYTASQFTNLLRRQLSRQTTFVFKTHRDYAVDPDSIIVSGLFDCYDYDNKLPSITITLSYHPEQDTYFVDTLNWEQLAFDLAECVGHEMVHMHQHVFGRAPALKKYKSSDEEQAYLGGDDEIEAYGFSIAAEQHAFNKPLQECVMYGVYCRTFEADTKVVYKLEQQVQQYHKELGEIYEQTN